MSDHGVRLNEDDGDDDTFLIRWPFQDSSWFGTFRTLAGRQCGSINNEMLDAADWG